MGGRRSGAGLATNGCGRCCRGAKCTWFVGECRGESGDAAGDGLVGGSLQISRHRQ
jgi:hypothetical protein